MKRFLSWLVVPLCLCVSAFVAVLIYALSMHLLDLIENLPSFLYNIVFYLTWGVIFALLILPVYYGALLTVSASETVCKTVKGTRYFVFSLYFLFNAIINLILNHKETFAVPVSVYTIIFSIILLFMSRNFKKQYEN